MWIPLLVIVPVEPEPKCTFVLSMRRELDFLNEQIGPGDSWSGISTAFWLHALCTHVWLHALRAHVLTSCTLYTRSEFMHFIHTFWLHALRPHALNSCTPYTCKTGGSVSCLIACVHVCYLNGVFSHLCQAWSSAGLWAQFNKYHILKKSFSPTNWKRGLRCFEWEMPSTGLGIWTLGPQLALFGDLKECNFVGGSMSLVADFEGL